MAIVKKTKRADMLLLLFVFFLSTSSSVSVNKLCPNAHISSLLQHDGPDAESASSTIVDHVTGVCHHQDDVMCCPPRVQSVFLSRARHELTQLTVRATGTSLAGKLHIAIGHVQDDIRRLIDMSRRATTTLLSITYPHLFDRTYATKNSINRLFADLTDAILQRDGVDFDAQLKSIIDRCLADIFPSTMLCVIVEPCRSVSTNYSECLRAHAIEWRAFGGEPDRIVSILSSALIEYRFAISIIDSLQQMITASASDVCIRQFTRLKYCSLCTPMTDADRMHVRYCGGYCRQVIGECFDKRTAGWNSMIESIARLAPDAHRIFTVTLPAAIQRAIVVAVEIRAPMVASAARNQCGSLKGGSKTIVVTDQLINSISSTRDDNHHNVSTLNPGRLRPVLAQLGAYRGWWTRLAHALCSDAGDDMQCWNGTAVDRYIVAYTANASTITSTSIDHNQQQPHDPSSLSFSVANGAGARRSGPIRQQVEGSGSDMAAPWRYDDEDNLQHGSGAASGDDDQVDDSNSSEAIDVGGDHVWSADETRGTSQTPTDGATCRIASISLLLLVLFVTLTWR